MVLIVAQQAESDTEPAECFGHAVSGPQRAGAGVEDFRIAFGPGNVRDVISHVFSPGSLGLQDDLDAAVLLVAEHLVHLGPLFETDRVGDDKRWIDLPLLNAAQKVIGPTVDVRLARPDGQPLVHHLTHRDLVDQPAIDTWDRNHPGRAADVDHLAKDVRPVAFGSQHLLGAVVDRIRHGGRDMGFQPDGVDALLRALATGELVQTLDHALFIEVDGNGATGFRHFQALRHMIDGDHLLGAEEDGAADRHLTDGTAAPDRNGIGRLDIALDGGLPSGREDVTEEENLLVRDTIRHLDVRRISKGNAEIFGLPARIAAGQMRVVEQACGRVAEYLVSEILLAVGGLAHREIAAFALVALAADDCERNHHPVTDLELVLGLRPDLDDLSHHLMSHDVAGQHRRDEVVEQVQVRAADCTTGHLDDGVARLLDFGVSDGIAPDVFLAVPNQGSHAFLLHPAKVQRPVLPGMLWTEGHVSAGVVCRTQNPQTGTSLTSS